MGSLLEIPFSIVISSISVRVSINQRIPYNIQNKSCATYLSFKHPTPLPLFLSLCLTPFYIAFLFFIFLPSLRLNWRTFSFQHLSITQRLNLYGIFTQLTDMSPILATNVSKPMKDHCKNEHAYSQNQTRSSQQPFLCLLYTFHSCLKPICPTHLQQQFTENQKFHILSSTTVCCAHFRSDNPGEFSQEYTFIAYNFKGPHLQWLVFESNNLNLDIFNLKLLLRRLRETT